MDMKLPFFINGNRGVNNFTFGNSFKMPMGSKEVTDTKDSEIELDYPEINGEGPFNPPSTSSSQGSNQESNKYSGSNNFEGSNKSTNNRRKPPQQFTIPMQGGMSMMSGGTGGKYSQFPNPFFNPHAFSNWGSRGQDWMNSNPQNNLPPGITLNLGNYPSKTRDDNEAGGRGPSQTQSEEN